MIQQLLYYERRQQLGVGEHYRVEFSHFGCRDTIANNLQPYTHTQCTGRSRVLHHECWRFVNRCYGLRNELELVEGGLQSCLAGEIPGEIRVNWLMTRL